MCFRTHSLASIVDKDKGINRELLKAPIRFELLDDVSPNWPAWEIPYSVVQRPALEYAGSPVIRVIEQGPARAGIEVTRRAGPSSFVQRIRLTSNSDRVDIETLVDWKSPGHLLKAIFPFMASNPKATYDLGWGVISRDSNSAEQYEVPAQQWADITDVEQVVIHRRLHRLTDIFVFGVANKADNLHRGAVLDDGVPDRCLIAKVPAGEGMIHHDRAPS